MTPGRKRHLAILQMKAGARKQLQVARVVIVEMRDDDVFDLSTIDSQKTQAIAWLTQKLPAAPFGSRCIKSGIYDNCVRVVAGDPNEVVHGHGPMVRICADEDLRMVAR